MLSKEDSSVHRGHRARMRARLTDGTDKSFYTYELLEMLLYYSIAYRDTNPISKGLLDRFGSLRGVLCATAAELATVKGVGPASAELIKLVDELVGIYMLGADDDLKIYDDYDSTSELVVAHMRGRSEPSVSLFFFDGGMRLIDTVDVEGRKYGSGGFRTSIVLEHAIRFNASVVAIGYTKSSGLVFPEQCDIVTTDMLKKELASSGICLAEVFLVKDNTTIGVTTLRGLCADSSVMLRRFNDEKREKAISHRILLANEQSIGPIGQKTVDALARLLSYAVKEDVAFDISLKLIKKYHDLETVFCIGYDTMVLDNICEGAAFIIRLVAYVISRSFTDMYSIGKLHGIAETAQYLCAAYMSIPVETVYMLLFDKNGRFMECVYMGEGTVNASDVYPRRLAERAVAKKASSVIIAHNHPRGTSRPSDDDVFVTGKLRDVLSGVNIKLRAHLVVAGQSCSIITVSDKQDISISSMDVSLDVGVLPYV